MIQLISANNVALVLDPKTRIRMEWSSPFFNTDVIKGDKVFWFDIPLNPINIQELQHANYPGVSGKDRIMDFTLILLETISITGKLVVSTFKTKFRCAFTTNTLQAYKEMLISEVTYDSDINLGSTTQDVIDAAADTNILSYPATDYVFPVIENNDLYGGSNPVFIGYMNNWDFLNNEFFINFLETIDPDVDTTDGINNWYALSPQFFLQYILDKIFTEMGLDHFGEFITESDYQQLLLFNAYCLDDNEDEYWAKWINGFRGTHPTLIEWDSSDQDFGSEMHGLPTNMFIEQGGWHTVKLKVKVTSNPITDDLNVRIINVNMVSPIFKEITILQADASNTEIVELIYTFYAATGDYGNNDYLQFVVSSAWTIVNAEMDIVNSSETNLNRYAKSIGIANHIPGVPINDFLNKLRELWQMAIIIDSTNTQAHFVFLKDLFVAQAEDLTSKIKVGDNLESINKKTINVDFDWDTDDNFLDISQYNDRGDFDQYIDLPSTQSIADIATMNPSNNIFKVNYIDFENIWQRFTDVSQKRTFGTGDDIIDILIGMHPALMSGYIYQDEKTKSEFLFTLARINKQGKSKLFNSENDLDPILKLTNWFELGDFERTDQVNDTYPFATSHDVDSLGVATGKYSMFLKGANTIGEIYHKPWFDWLQNTETFSFDSGANFGAADLLTLLNLIKPQKGIAIADQKRWMFIESIKYLPETINAQITMQGLESVEVKAVKQAFD